MSVFPQVKGAIAAGFLPQALADAVDQGVAAFDAQIRDLAASSDRIALADVDVLVNSIFAPAQFQVGGVTIDRDLPSDNPSSLWLADGLHAGTVAQGLLANVFIDAMDDEFTGVSLDSKWTIVDPSAITASVTKSYGNSSWMSFSCPSSVQNRIFAITQPAPAGTWKVRAKISLDSATWNFFGIYMIARRSSVSKSSVAGPLYHSSYGAITMYATRITEPSTLAIDQDLYDVRQDTMYLELEYDGTNMIWRISKSGSYYTRFWQEAAATFLGAAPTSVGINFHFYGGSSDANHIMTGSVDWFRRVA